MNDIVRALAPVVDALDALGRTYRVGGSVASSALGVPRSTLDVDIVCELRDEDVGSFVAALRAAYYVDEDMIRDAIRRRASFNVVHLDTMMKVDVFVARGGAYDSGGALAGRTKGPRRVGSRVRSRHGRGHRPSQARVVPPGPRDLGTPVARRHRRAASAARESGPRVPGALGARAGAGGVARTGDAGGAGARRDYVERPLPSVLVVLVVVARGRRRRHPARAQRRVHVGRHARTARWRAAHAPAPRRRSSPRDRRGSRARGFSCAGR